MNLFALNTRPLNNYSTLAYGNLLQPLADTEGYAETSSTGFGATLQRQVCEGATLPFTWGHAACSQRVASIQGFAVHNGTGYGQITAPLQSVSGIAATGTHGALATTQPLSRLAGAAWSVSSANGSSTQHLSKCRGTVHSVGSGGVLNFDRDAAPSGQQNPPATFTILEFTRE